MAADQDFESLVLPLLDDLRYYCLSLTRSPWDAEDLAQDALLKVFLYVQHTGTERITRSFLLSAARLLWLDGFRKRKRREDAILFLNDRYTDPDYAGVRSLIEWLAAQMPMRSAQLWLLSEYFGFSTQEIAEKMKMSVSAVKSSLHRTRLLLQGSGSRPGSRRRQYRPPYSELERWVHAVMLGQPQLIG